MVCLANLLDCYNLVNEEYAAKDLKGLEDFENPLDPVNHLHYLIEVFVCT